MSEGKQGGRRPPCGAVFDSDGLCRAMSEIGIFSPPAQRQLQVSFGG